MGPFVRCPLKIASSYEPLRRGLDSNRCNCCLGTADEAGAAGVKTGQDNSAHEAIGEIFLLVQNQSNLVFDAR